MLFTSPARTRRPIRPSTPTGSPWLQKRDEADEAAANQIIEATAGLKAAEGAAGATAFRPKIYVSADVDETALKRLRELGEVTYTG